MEQVANKLPYLQAVITETLRLWPTIPGTRPRVVAREPAQIQGEMIPVGVSCLRRLLYVKLSPV